MVAKLAEIYNKDEIELKDHLSVVFKFLDISNWWIFFVVGHFLSLQ